jgi:hypothetical protein
MAVVVMSNCGTAPVAAGVCGGWRTSHGEVGSSILVKLFFCLNGKVEDVWERDLGFYLDG